LDCHDNLCGDDNTEITELLRVVQKPGRREEEHQLMRLPTAGGTPSEQTGDDAAGGAGQGSADALLREKERAENFPVALRVLPRRVRTHLTAVYDVVRTVDDLGDEAAGDRTALLKEFRADQAAIWTGGAPRHPVLRRLAPTVRACGLAHEPFDRIVQANLVDQRVASYATYEELRDYCRLSADPVGRIVLGVFDAETPETVELSDRVCTALQMVEHWQDVAEDRRRGRVYLPREDLDRFGVAEADLDLPAATAPVRRLVLFETERAAELLESGAPLVRLLRGWARVAVAGYVAGGRGAVAALRRCGGDVLAASPRTRRRDVVREVRRQLLTRGAR
jgi:squalene synthase HpnC